MLLFKVKKKTNPKGPDYRSMEPEEVNGQMVEAALWVRTDKNGNAYFSIKFQAPRERNEEGRKNEDEGLPF